MGTPCSLRKSDEVGLPFVLGCPAHRRRAQSGYYYAIHGRLRRSFYPGHSNHRPIPAIGIAVTPPLVLIGRRNSAFSTLLFSWRTLGAPLSCAKTRPRH